MFLRFVATAIEVSLVLEWRIMSRDLVPPDSTRRAMAVSLQGLWAGGGVIERRASTEGGDGHGWSWMVVGFVIANSLPCSRINQ
jgi:hypothetical protein